MSLPAALVVDVVDPTGASGLTIDARVFADLEVEGRFAPTGLRVSSGILEFPDAAVVTAVETGLAEGRIQGVRVGVHRGMTVAGALARILSNHDRVPLVITTCSGSHSDPSGAQATWSEAVRHFAGMARVAVVRVAEVGAASGQPWSGLGGARAAAEAIRGRGFRAAVVSGVVSGGRVVDLVDDDGEWVALDGPRVEAPRIPGLPGTFAAALTAGLADGLGLLAAVRRAQQHVASRLRLANSEARATETGRGSRRSR